MIESRIKKWNRGQNKRKDECRIVCKEYIISKTYFSQQDMSQREDMI